MKEKRNKNLLKRIWHFIWEDNSIWSWIVNIVLAFVLIKFLVYPGLGFLLGTGYPIVAVVSESMEHDKLGFYDWWQVNHEWYEDNGITRQDFESYNLKDGFNKGDIIILKGNSPQDLKTGDVIVFKARQPDPVIHRIVKKWEEQDEYYFQTKGDNNPSSISNHDIDETRISEKQVIGKAVFKIPYLGYIKIWFVGLISLVV